MEQAEKVNSELRDANIAYERAAAEERQRRDHLVAIWRDTLHNAMQSPALSDLIRASHQVMDSMDAFLNHAGGRRK